MPRLLLCCLVLSACKTEFDGTPWVEREFVATPGTEGDPVEGLGLRLGVRIVAADAEGMGAVVAPLDDGDVQQDCHETAQTVTTVFEPPTVRFATVDLTYETQGVVMPMFDVVLEGTLRDDASGIDDLRIAARLEVSGLDLVMGTEVCPMFEATGHPCEPCLEVEGDCWPFETLGGQAEAGEIDLVERSASDIASDPDC